MQEGTTPGKEEVELRQEQQPRATQATDRDVGSQNNAEAVVGAVAEVESRLATAGMHEVRATQEQLPEQRSRGAKVLGLILHDTGYSLRS